MFIVDDREINLRVLIFCGVYEVKMGVLIRPVRAHSTEKCIFFGFCLFIFGITNISHEGFTRQVFYLFIALPAFLIFIKSVFLGRGPLVPEASQRAFILVFMFFIYCFSSVFWGDLDISGKVSFIERFYYLLFFLLAIFVLSSQPTLLQKIPLVFVGFSTLSLCMAIIVWEQDVNRLRGVGRIEISTHAASFYCMASVLAAFYAHRMDRSIYSIFCHILSLFLMLGTVLTVSRATMVINIFLLLSLAFIHVRGSRWKVLSIAAAAGLILLLSLGVFFPEKLAVLQQKGLDSARYTIWASGVELFIQQPFFGVGLGINETIQVDFGRFQSTHHAHNLFLDYAVRLGVVGLAGLLILIGIAVRHGIYNPDYHPWLIMLVVYLLFSLVSGRVVLDRIQPDWVTFYLPWFVLLAAPRRRLIGGSGDK